MKHLGDSVSPNSPELSKEEAILDNAAATVEPYQEAGVALPVMRPHQRTIDLVCKAQHDNVTGVYFKVIVALDARCCLDVRSTSKGSLNEVGRASQILSESRHFSPPSAPQYLYRITIAIQPVFFASKLRVCKSPPSASR